MMEIFYVINKYTGLYISRGVCLIIKSKKRQHLMCPLVAEQIACNQTNNKKLINFVFLVLMYYCDLFQYNLYDLSYFFMLNSFVFQ